MAYVEYIARIIVVAASVVILVRNGLETMLSILKYFKDKVKEKEEAAKDLKKVNEMKESLKKLIKATNCAIRGEEPKSIEDIIDTFIHLVELVDLSSNQQVVFYSTENTVIEPNKIEDIDMVKCFNLLNDEARRRGLNKQTIAIVRNEPL